MIDTIRDLARFMARDTLTFDEVVARLGEVVERGVEGGPTRLASSDPRFEEVKLWRDMKTGGPYLVDVSFSPAARVPVAELVRALGPFKPVFSTEIGATPEILFQGVAKGRAFAATITARVEGAGDRLEEGSVTGLSILRDVRVD